MKRSLRDSAAKDKTETGERKDCGCGQGKDCTLNRPFHWAPGEFVHHYRKTYPSIRFLKPSDVKAENRGVPSGERLVGPPPHLEYLKEISHKLWKAARAKAEELNVPWNDARELANPIILNDIELMTRRDRDGYKLPTEDEVQLHANIIETALTAAFK